MSERTPQLGTIINEAIRRRLIDVNTAIVGRVERVDLATGLVDVKVLIKEPLELDDGTVEPESVPILRNVPIHHWGGSGLRVGIPVGVGDSGELIFQRRSIDEWQTYGGEVEPTDLRTHDLSDAIFQPGVRANPDAWKAVEAAAITIGKDGGPFQGVPMGEDLKSFLDALKLYIDTHTHPTAVGPTSVPITTSPSVPALVSATVKVSS